MSHHEDLNGCNRDAAMVADVKTTFAVDQNDRLVSMSDSSGKTTYVFDALGRRTSQTLSGTTATYTWDNASRLTFWTRGADSAIYTYDAAGQRTRTVHTQGGTTPVVTTTDFTYDGITLLALSAAQGTATWRVTYLYDEDGRPYAGVYTAGASAPVTFLIATNDRGDVVGLTNTAGTWFARYTYDPYGRVLAQSAQAVSGITATLASQIATRQVLRYASYAYDAHSATYYVSARHYDPASCQFLTKDPARDDGEESAYQYCGGDPVGKVDPTGEVSARIQSLWNAVVRERPSPEWLLKIPGARFLAATARMSWYVRNARWFLRTARAIVYNEMRTASPSKWREARSLVSTAGEEGGLLLYFRSWPHADYTWFKNAYLGDAGRMAQIMHGQKLGSLRRWA